MESTPLVSASEPTIVDPILNIAEEPLMILDDGTSVVPWTNTWTTSGGEIAIEPSIFDEVSAVTPISDPLAVASLSESIVPVESPSIEPEISAVVPEAEPEAVAVFETSPIGILEESIDKLKWLEEEAKQALDKKNKEDEGYKEQINELKWLDKVALQEASKIERDIEHIEEIITTFSKELDKERWIVDKTNTKK